MTQWHKREVQACWLGNVRSPEMTQACWLGKFKLVGWVWESIKDLERIPELDYTPTGRYVESTKEKVLHPFIEKNRVLPASQTFPRDLRSLGLCATCVSNGPSLPRETRSELFCPCLRVLAYLRTVLCCLRLRCFAMNFVLLRRCVMLSGSLHLSFALDVAFPGLCAASG